MITTYDNGSIVRQIRSSIAGFNMSVYSYVLYHEDRFTQQFFSEYKTAKQLIGSARFHDPYQQQVLDNISKGIEDTNDLFIKLVSNHEDVGSAEQQLSETLFTRSFEVDSNASLLRSLIDDDLKDTQKNIVISLILIMILVVTTFTIVMRITRKRIVSSLSALNEGTKIIGSGNLDFKIPRMTDDEIGELSLAFNSMTKDLKSVIISKHELEKEITARKKTETELEHVINQLAKEKSKADELLAFIQYEKDVLDEIMENTQAQVAYMDKDFNFIKVNSSYAKGIGKTLQEFIGKNYFDFSPDENREIFMTVKSTGRPKKHLAKPLTYANQPSKRMTYWDWTLSPVKNIKRKTLGFLLSQLDVTKRVYNEQRLSAHAVDLRTMTTELTKFKLAVENAFDVILIMDSDGLIVFASKAVGKVFGYTQKEILGQNLSLLGGNILPDFYKKLWETIKIQKSPFSGEMYNRRKNGTMFPSEVHISPVLDYKNDKPEFFVGIVRDITEQKKTDQTKTEFISLTAHQLRTPLTTIGLTAELLLRDIAGELNPTGRKYLRSINEDITYMSKLIGVFLDVSRLELGVFEVHPAPCDLKKLINKSLSEIEASIVKKEIKLEMYFEKKLPKVSLDKNVINIVLENILSNAVKYTPEHGSIRISLVKEKKDLLFAVTDNGCGIPKADQDYVFAKLYRAANVRNGGSEGIGLGLYLAKNLTEKTGGKLYFTSEENKGSTFYVSIPLSGMTEKRIKTFDF